MYKTPEQLIAINKANVDAAMRLAGVALQGVEKLVDLQMQAVRSALAEGASNARAIAAAKGVEDLAALPPTLLQPSIEKATSYARDVVSLATATQAELNKLVEAQMAEFNSTVVAQLDKVAQTAPPGTEFAVNALRAAVASANAAIENVSKVARQVSEITEANIAAAQPAKKKAA